MPPPTCLTDAPPHPFALASPGLASKKEVVAQLPLPAAALYFPYLIYHISSDCGVAREKLVVPFGELLPLPVELRAYVLAAGRAESALRALTCSLIHLLVA